MNENDIRQENCIDIKKWPLNCGILIHFTYKEETYLANIINEPAHEIMVPVQSRQSLRCSHAYSMEVDEGSDQKSDT